MPSHSSRESIVQRVCRQHEQVAIEAACFYIYIESRQLRVFSTFWGVWIGTKILIEGLEAVVTDLENFFAEEYSFEPNVNEEAGHPEHYPNTASSLRMTK